MGEPITAPSSWDPLKNVATSELFNSSIKQQITNILNCYTGWYDLPSELIQNALDAVEARKELGEKDYKPHIWIKIDMKNNLISVTDNGIGFNESEFRSFLAPNISFKGLGKRGNKGVGATYLAYGFNFIQIGTKTDNFSFIGHMIGGREWVEDLSDKKIRPMVEPSDGLLSDSFNEIDRGSTFTIKLVGNFIRPTDLAWVGAHTADQWEIVLKIKSPLGGIYFDKAHPDINCNLTVVDVDGNKTEKPISDCRYIFPHTVINSCKDLKEIQKKQEELILARTDASRLPDSFHKLNGLYAVFYPNELLSDTGVKQFNLSDTDRQLVGKYNIHLYSFYCYTTALWDAYNDDIAKLRRKGRILKGGLHLSTNNMLQGESITIPLTKAIGRQQTTHAVVHFNNAHPDLGRKGFQPELLELGEKLAARSIKIFSGWSRLLKQNTGAPPEAIAERAIHDWILDQEKHEKSNPLVINRKDLFLPLKEPSITSEPLHEQDVISLFNQLLAGGVIRGIKIMSTRQHTKYDGVYKFSINKPFENHIFDKEKNPLGIEKDKYNEEFTSVPSIFEYKYSFDGLLEDIENGTKNERDIKLVVAWTMGDEWKKRYAVTPLSYLDNYHHRPFHGATHIMKNYTGDVAFYAIILDELVNYINDPEKVQDYQKKKYIEVLAPGEN